MKISENNNCRVNLSGVFGEMLDFVKREQLLNTDLWKKFAEEYRVKQDSDDRGWRGEFWGKMMRGASLVCDATKDEELYAVLESSVREILTLPDENGRISTYTVEKEYNGWDVWNRKYILLGLYYFLSVCRSEDLKKSVIAVMCGQADYMIRTVGDGEGQTPLLQTSKWYGGLNSASVLEPFVFLYRLTGKSAYLNFAKQIVGSGASRFGNLFDLAYADEVAPYRYPVTKAYEMMSCFEGLLAYYEVTGDEKCRKAVENFAHRVAEEEVTVVGGAGCSMECFDHAGKRQASGSTERLMQETCVTVTWMKLCYRMYCLTGDVFFAECFETSFYNSYASAFNTEHILNDAVFPPYVKAAAERLIPTLMPFDSYAPLRRGIRGQAIGGAKLLRDGTYYGCCTSIASAGIGLAAKMVVMPCERGIVCSLYPSGTAEVQTPGGQTLRLNYSTAYPIGDTVRIALALERDEEFSVFVRIPAWSRQSTVTVNGKAISEPVTGGLLELRRVWNGKSEIALTFAMPVRTVPAPTYETDEINAKVDWTTGENIREADTATEDTARHIAFLRGPLVLARDARISPLTDAVDFPLCEAEIKVDTLDAPAGFRLLVQAQDRSGKNVLLTDCASAGKTWSEASACEVWIPTV